MLRRVAVVAAASAVVLGLTAPAAAALVPEASAAGALCARTSGNRAGACLYSNYQRPLVRLWDNACDGHRAYAEYFLGGTKHKFAPRTKCRRSYTKRHGFWHSGTPIKIRVCIEDWGRNTCSKWAKGRL